MTGELSVTVVADSVSRYGDRITTLQCTFPRFLLPEFNTHRAFSRNSASSRARSTKKTIQEVREAPFVPWHWPSERVGMAGGAELSGQARSNVERLWWVAAHTACEDAEALVREGLHKSIVNRILEPFMWHTVVVTATDWEGFFAQRLALLEDGTPAAEPHFFDLAREMFQALERSKPRELTDDQWHTPYVTEQQWDVIANTPEYGSWWLVAGLKASVARCAGVSYLNQDADRPLQKDIALYQRLRSADPPHWSPFEHVARPVPAPTQGGTYVVPDNWFRRYNLSAWSSLRWFLENGATLGEEVT